MDTTNSVTLLGFYGGDETHCLSAWQSTNIELDIELPQEIKDRIHILFEETVKNKSKSPFELLKMLAELQHHTPFEKSCIHFQVKADIASHIHVIKHRISTSVNSESARYKELKDKYYLPIDWKYSDKFYPSDNITLEKWRDILDSHTKQGHAWYHKAVEELSPILGRSRAKESARYFLTYNKQLDFDVMFNFRSFMHFQGLRNSPHAQKEIRDIASSMLDQVKNIPEHPFKYSLEAFGY